MSLFQSANVRVTEPADGIATLSLDVEGRSLNVLTRGVLADLDAALAAVSAERRVQILVVRSAKPTGFMAGADLRSFTEIATAEAAHALSAAGQETFGRLARLPIPTVAVIGGPCLGGGLELALACDYRLVIDQPKTQLGLPEIELGLLPAWGGTQRLPRLIGLERALHMLLGRKRLNSREALRWGLADAVSGSDDVEVTVALAELIVRARRRKKRPHERLPLRTWRQWLVESNPLGRALIFRGSQRVLRQRVPDDMPAPAEALAAVRIGLKKGLEAGLAAEREAVGRLALTPACRNLVGLAIQQLYQAKELPAELREKPKPIRKVGVVGGGTMGAGIAQLAAVKGFDVVIHEVSATALDAGIRRIEQLFTKAVENRVLTDDQARARLAGIRGTYNWEGFGDVDLVVEAVVENLEIKRKVFQELESRTKPDAFLATNTSSLLVEQIQAGAKFPERIGGLHFFNPVHKMPLVEVVRGPASNDLTASSLAQWAIELGKSPVVVKDSPGFVVNRILMPYLGEAVLLLGEPGGSVRAVDAAMKRFGMPMGPLELLDQVGIDVAAHIEKSIRPAFGDRFNAESVFTGLVERAWLGRKTGIGFYRYKGEAKKENREARSALPESIRIDQTQIHKTGKRAAEPDWQRPELRMALLMVNEAAACLGEGLAASAEAIDRAMILGTGWAPHRGGPLRWAEQRGLPEVVRLLGQMAGFCGPRFEPCAELRRRAEAGEAFYKPAELLAKTG
jgi:3-hydroxyacyl-CoA dehydrogenase/enoyl-CoA hydratase/3-hydroxybutyryl-CoA epimerase